VKPIAEDLKKILKRYNIGTYPQGGVRIPGHTPRSTASKEAPAKSIWLSGFIAIPRTLDDLIIRLGECPETRGIAKALHLVVTDLMRHTDRKHGDVIVSNYGIKRRRRIGLASVKAAISLLLHMKVLRYEQPSRRRLIELKRDVPGGFNGNRRYLVWNPEDAWQLNEKNTNYDDITRHWVRYRGKRKEVGICDRKNQAQERSLRGSPPGDHIQ
jgi:hypothetical protein